jgi:hypothetical protein
MATEVNKTTEVNVADGMPASFEVTPVPQDLLRRVLEGLRRS